MKSTIREFLFNTGVKASEPNSIKGRTLGTKVIPFYCEDVPQNAIFKFASDSAPVSEGMIKVEIINTKEHPNNLFSKYAYFLIPS